MKLTLAMITSLTLFGACSSSDDDGETPVPIDPAGTHTQYVVDSLKVPTTGPESTQLGVNLDKDDRNRIDNALGQVLSALATAGSFDIQGAVDEPIQRGEVIVMMNIQSTSLTTAAGVGSWVFLGDNAAPAPCENDQDETCGKHLQGDATFNLHMDSPKNSHVVGQLINGKFTTQTAGKVSLELSLIEGGTAIRLDLIGAHIEFQVDDDGLVNGKLAGAVEDEDLNTNILPGLVDVIEMTFAEVCTGDAAPCCDEATDEGKTGNQVYSFFDQNDDCRVDLDELKTNSTIAAVLSPDIDLLDNDGKNDSLSLGVGFTAKKASFPLPSEVSGQ